MISLSIKTIGRLETVAKVLSDLLNPEDKVLLSGGLGAGKTTLIKAICKNLGIKDAVTSPSFSLVQTYGDVTHIDLYRLSNEAQLDQLDIDYYLSKPDSICFIEWAERLGPFYPKEGFKVDLDLTADDRLITISGFGHSYSQRLKAVLKTLKTTLP